MACTHLGSGTENKYSGEAAPVVYNGVIYVVTGADDVFAVSVESGQGPVAVPRNLDQAINTICCGWTSRGVGLGDGRLYVGQLDGKLVALDQQTGAPFGPLRPSDGRRVSITTAPLYYDGLVITGFAGAEYGVRGRVKAFDAADGHLVWTFYTIPGPGEVGHETWPQDSKAWEHGGASVWQTPAVDPALGLLYFSTGNAGPDFNGAARKGDNLFASSIVAVEAKTGRYRWHFQQVHHDIWDYDSPNPVVLLDLAYRGTTRKALAQASKTGWVYILDRATGRPIVGIEERRVPQEPRQATSPTQPFPVGDTFVPQSMTIAPEGFTLVNQGRIFTPFFTDPIVAKPGQSGGANWGPSSYDPTTDISTCAPRIGRASSGRKPQQPIRLSASGSSEGGSAAITWAYGHLRRTRYADQQARVATAVARRCYSGSVTASGLVFIGRGDGRLTALNGESAHLWQFQTGAGVNAPPSIFEQQGQQVIAVYSGGSLFGGAARRQPVALLAERHDARTLRSANVTDARVCRASARACRALVAGASTTSRIARRTPMSQPHDAIIVGARCAGSPTAMLLARKGYRVLVVDRATFPSDTVSTHVVQPLARAALARWGLLDRLDATGCPPIHTYTFDFGPFTMAGSPGTKDAPVAYCPRRTVLDKLLVDAAAEAGAEIREGFTVEEVGDRGRPRRRHQGPRRAGRRVTERAQVVIGADGRYSLGRRRRSSPSSTTRSRRCSPPITRTGAACRWTGGSRPTSARSAVRRGAHA